MRGSGGCGIRFMGEIRMLWGVGLWRIRMDAYCVRGSFSYRDQWIDCYESRLPLPLSPAIYTEIFHNHSLH